MKKKKIIKIAIFIILLPIIFLIMKYFICFTISKTNIYPKALKFDLKEDYKFNDYKIDQVMHLLKRTEEGEGINGDLEGYEDWFEYKGDNKYYGVKIDTPLQYGGYIPNLKSFLKNNRQNTNKKDLKQYYKLNDLCFYGSDYYNVGYYGRKEFIEKTKIINQKNNTFIIYPIAYSPSFIMGPVPEYLFYQYFEYHYVENILILYNDFVIQIKVYAHSKENLTDDTIKYANKLLDQLYKASIDENYKIKLLYNN